MPARNRVPASSLPRIIIRDGERCLYCGGPWSEVEHLIPKALGGPHNIWNLGLSCVKCNRRKRNKIHGPALDHLLNNLYFMLAETIHYVNYQRELGGLRRENHAGRFRVAA